MPLVIGEHALQPVTHLLEGDMPVEVVAPVAVDTSEPFPFDCPFEPLQQGHGLCGLICQCIRKLDPATELQGSPLARIRQFVELVLPEFGDFPGKFPHRVPA
ncbi:hypothetical protein ABSY17_18280 [Mesorhizobium sp. ANAO-SY3R2]